MSQKKSRLLRNALYYQLSRFATGEKLKGMLQVATKKLKMEYKEASHKQKRKLSSLMGKIIIKEKLR